MAEDRRRDSRLDLRLVRYFLAVVDHGGVTGAARALFLAQPSLSQAIRNLEEHLGTPLFHRAGGRMRLTTAGEEFAVAARVIALDVDRARAAVRAVQDLDAGSLEVATTTPWEMDPLPGLVAGLRRAHPGIVVTVGMAAGDQDVVEEVRRGRAEIGLVGLPVTAHGLRIVPLAPQEIVLVTSRAMAESLPEPVPLADLVDVPMVRVGSGAEPTDLPGRVVVECAYGPAVWEMVRGGAGAAFLPRRLMEDQVVGLVVRSTSPPISRRIGVVLHPFEPSPAADAFLAVAATGRPHHVEERARDR